MAVLGKLARWQRTFILGMVMLPGNCLCAAPLEDMADEYQVKAAFLYNFAKFVEWPPESFQNSAEPFTICVLGIDPFGRFLQDVVTGRAIAGRTLVVRHVSDIRQVAGCQELFISSAESKRLSPPIGEIRTPGVLTIGDSNSPSPNGAVINFMVEGGKVRFGINVNAAERGKLRISSRLLSLGKQ